jgi:glycosidase
MQWDASTNAGFSSNAAPWLPVPPSYTTVNVKAEDSDPHSLLAWYESLIQLKKHNPVLAHGGEVMLDNDNPKVLSWMRISDDAPPIVVSVNFTAEAQTVNLTGSSTEMRSTPVLKPRPVKTLFKSPGGADPASVDHIDLGAFGVYIGQVQ